MSIGPLVSYRAGTHLFCYYFLCHLSYRQQFVWYPGYHGYQFYAALVVWWCCAGMVGAPTLKLPVYV